MAAAFAHAWLQRNGTDGIWKVISRGLTEDYEPPGSPANPNGVIAMSAYSIDTSGHVSNILRRAEVENADIIVGMTTNHIRYIREDFNDMDLSKKLMTLGVDIQDPWHQPLSEYRHCASQLKEATDDFMDRTFHGPTFKK